MPHELTIYIDNSEVVRRGECPLPSLGVKQQLVLDYDLWATTARLLEELPCEVQWKWVKGHQTVGKGPKWKLDVALNNFCDSKAESGRAQLGEGEHDPFFPDQHCGISWEGRRIHGGPRETIMMAAHGDILQTYICNKNKWTQPVFQSVDWMGFKVFCLNWIIFDKPTSSSLYITGLMMVNNKTYSLLNNTSPNARQNVAK